MHTTKRPQENPLAVYHLRRRNRHLNAVLLSRHGGRMKSPKRPARSAEKHQLRRAGE